MRTRAALAGAVLLLCARVVCDSHRQQPVFRSFADSVALDVLVTDGKRPVQGLSAADFEVTDSGVRQTILDVTHETLPLDVTLSIDVSASIRGFLLEALVRALNRVRERLRAEDRLSLHGFNQRIGERIALSPARSVPAIQPPATSGQTSLYDALAIALVSAPDADRRQMAILFTDGLDTASFLREEQVVAIAQRSRTTAFFVAAPAVAGQIPLQLMQQVADTTGGIVQVIKPNPSYTIHLSGGGDFPTTIVGPGGNDALEAGFLRALDDFRTSYVVRYTPEGVTRLGWHEVVVRASRDRKTLETRTRRGYAVDR
jgi:VWFA-related protein